MKHFNKDEMIEMLRGFIYSKHKNASKFAEHVGCSQVAVSRVLNGGLKIPDEWLKLMGYESVTIYRKVKK